MSWSQWETMEDVGRQWETQTAGVGKGWSSRESLGDVGRRWETLGDVARRWETLGVVEVVAVYSQTTCKILTNHLVQAADLGAGGHLHQPLEEALGRE